MELPLGRPMRRILPNTTTALIGWDIICVHGTGPRKHVTCSDLDVNTCYFLQLSYTKTPVRTFDPSHAPSTTWSTCWSEVVLDHLTLAPQHVRKLIFSSLANGNLNMKSLDTLYRVLTDSLPLGPVRCSRQDHTQGSAACAGT